jgi:hypothetical protein
MEQNYKKEIDYTNKTFKNVSVPKQNVSLKVAGANGIADYLKEQDWKRFCTFTTGYELTLPSARRLMERFYNRASDKVFDSMPIKLFWVAEKFEVKDGYHTHGLLNYPVKYEEQFNVMEVLTETFRVVSKQSNARVNLSKYNKKRSAAKYCAKYLLKSCSDYDFLC